jgi:hypothetical protein
VAALAVKRTASIVETGITVGSYGIAAAAAKAT